MEAVKERVEQMARKIFMKLKRSRRRPIKCKRFFTERNNEAAGKRDASLSK